MPIPAANSAWPPTRFEPYFKELEVYNSWYVGEPKGASPRALEHRAQLNGGVVGKVARAWYGTPQGETRTVLHVPTAADLATLSADYLFGEMPRFVYPGFSEQETEGEGEKPRDPLQERLEEVINRPEVHSTLLEAAELQSALGGVYLRLIYGGTIDRVLIDVVHADSAIPTFRYGELAEVTFWTTLESNSSDKSIVHRHLEHHELGRTEHGLYQGTEDNLGVRVPFTEHPDTTWLASAEMVDGVYFTGVPNRLDVCYIPNMRPNGKYRKSPALAQLGKSDYASIIPLFEQIDIVWASWMRDIRLAKARLLVASDLVQSNGPGQGGGFDVDQELVEHVGSGVVGPNGETAGIVAQQFAIRFEEHERTIRALTNKVMETAGWSPGSLGGSERGVRTATEVQSDQQLSRRTRDKKLNYWRALKEFSLTWMMLDAQVFGHDTPEDAPEVRFPAQVQVDEEAMGRTLLALKNAGAASIPSRVRRLDPSMEGEALNIEVSRIERELGIGTEVDPADVGTPRDDTGQERTPKPSDVARMAARLQAQEASTES